jgi:DNA-binding HxlR family transcriptional regulator
MPKTKAQKKEYNCYFELGIDIMGGKWKPIILYYIGVKSVVRYGELKKVIPSINERMLTRQLREMEADKIIKRKVYPQVPPKVEYSLEPIGQQLLPILIELKDWSVKYNTLYKKADFGLEEEWSKL